MAYSPSLQQTVILDYRSSLFAWNQNCIAVEIVGAIVFLLMLELCKFTHKHDLVLSSLYRTLFSGLEYEDPVRHNCFLADSVMSSTWQICKEKDAVSRSWEDVAPMQGWVIRGSIRKDGWQFCCMTPCRDSGKNLHVHHLDIPFGASAYCSWSLILFNAGEFSGHLLWTWEICWNAGRMVSFGMGLNSL